MIHQPLVGLPTVPAPDDDDDDCGAVGGMRIARVT